MSENNENTPKPDGLLDFETEEKTEVTGPGTLGGDDETAPGILKLAQKAGPEILLIPENTQSGARRSEEKTPSPMLQVEEVTPKPITKVTMKTSVGVQIPPIQQQPPPIQQQPPPIQQQPPPIQQQLPPIQSQTASDKPPDEQGTRIVQKQTTSFLESETVIRPAAKRPPLPDRSEPAYDLDEKTVGHATQTGFMTNTQAGAKGSQEKTDPAIKTDTGGKSGSSAKPDSGGKSESSYNTNPSYNTNVTYNTNAGAKIPSAPKGQAVEKIPKRKRSGIGITANQLAFLLAVMFIAYLVVQDSQKRAVEKTAVAPTAVATKDQFLTDMMRAMEMTKGNAN